MRGLCLLNVSSSIRLRVFAWVFLRIVAGCCLKIIFVTVARNEMESGFEKGTLKC